MGWGGTWWGGVRGGQGTVWVVPVPYGGGSGFPWPWDPDPGYQDACVPRPRMPASQDTCLSGILGLLTRVPTAVAPGSPHPLALGPSPRVPGPGTSTEARKRPNRGKIEVKLVNLVVK